jgi:hypothetical protein
VRDDAVEMPQTMPCPQCGQPTSPVTGLCPSCGQPEHAPATAQGQPQPQPQPSGQHSSGAGMLWQELAGFLELGAIFLPIGIAIALIALGMANLLVLLPAFLLAMGIGAYSWREK